MEQLTSDGVVSQDNRSHALSAVLAHGRDIHESLLATRSGFDPRWLNSGGADLLWIGSDAFQRRHPEVSRVTTDLTTWLDQRSEANLNHWELDDNPVSWFWSARALLRIDGEIRERVVLVDLNDVPDRDWEATVAAAFEGLGGVIAAGPEIGKTPPGELYWADVAFITRRHSTMPLDDYSTKYSITAPRIR